MPTLFRIDEFAITPDGTLATRDLTRLLNVGFDLAPTPPAGGAVAVTSSGLHLTTLRLGL